MTNDSQQAPIEPLPRASGYALTIDELGELSNDLDRYMDWAITWHRQAGGYTSSDTLLTIMKMNRWANILMYITGKPEFSLRKTNPHNQSLSRIDSQ